MDKNDYIFGIRAVIEAIEAGRSIDKVLVRRDLTGDLARELFAKVREYDIVMQRVPQEKLNRITMKNHQGAIALLSPVEYQRLEHLVPMFYEEGRNPLVVVLDGLTDTRNFGAIGHSHSRCCQDLCRRIVSCAGMQGEGYTFGSEVP